MFQKYYTMSALIRIMQLLNTTIHVSEILYNVCPYPDYASTKYYNTVHVPEILDTSGIMRIYNALKFLRPLERDRELVPGDSNPPFSESRHISFSCRI